MSTGDRANPDRRAGRIHRLIARAVPPGQPRPRRDRTYRVVIWAVRRGFTLLGLRIDIDGLERVPRTGPAIIASNHTGYLDFTFLGLVGILRGRFVRFLAKDATFAHRVSGPFMRAMGHIPVRRPVGTIAALRASRALEAGEIIGIFPEATISRSWTLKSMRRGAAYLAVAHGVPLVPMAAWGGHRVFTVGSQGGVRRGTAVTILLGEPLLPQPDEGVEELQERLRSALAALYDQAQATYPQTPRDDSDRWWLPRHLGGTAPTRAEATEFERVRDLARAAKDRERD